MKIITDTREQLPYWTTTKRKLEVGDYTTKELEGIFHIERKSLQDLYGTLVQGNGRFKYELWRAAYYQIKIEVFVEGTLDDFINKRFPYGKERKFSTHGLQELIKTFERKYHLPFYFHPTRKKCQIAVEMRLLEEEKKVKKSR
jgi:ERCC4-type nuclease